MMAVDYSVVHITQQLATNTDTLVLCFSIVGLFLFFLKAMYGNQDHL